MTFALLVGNLSKLDKLHGRLENLHLRYFWGFIKYMPVKLHICIKHKG